MMRRFPIVYAVLLLASHYSAPSQTPETTLNATPLVLPELPLRITVAPDGSSLVSAWRSTRYDSARAWSRRLAPDGSPLGPEGVRAGYFNIQFALDDDRWMFMERKDSIRDSIAGFPYQYVSDYRLRAEHQGITMGRTESLFEGYGMYQVWGDEGGPFHNPGSIRCVRFDSTVLIAAEYYSGMVHGGGARPPSTWMEQEWVLWKPGDPVSWHTLGESPVREENGYSVMLTDVLVGAFSESGIPWLIHRERLAKNSPVASPDSPSPRRAHRRSGDDRHPRRDRECVGGAVH